MNKVILTGRFYKDPEVRYTQTGKVCASFHLIVDKGYVNQQGQREGIFVPCIIWGKGAEFVGNNFVAKKWAEVEGAINIRSYDAKDGSKRYITEVICTSVSFVGPKDNYLAGGSSNAPAAQHEAPTGQYGAPAPQYSGGAQSGFDAWGQQVPPDETIPF